MPPLQVKHGAPVTSVMLLDGYPLAAVGLADNSVSIIHTGKDGVDGYVRLALAGTGVGDGSGSNGYPGLGVIEATAPYSPAGSSLAALAGLPGAPRSTTPPSPARRSTTPATPPIPGRGGPAVAAAPKIAAPRSLDSPRSLAKKESLAGVLGTASQGMASVVMMNRKAASLRRAKTPHRSKARKTPVGPDVGPTSAFYSCIPT